MHISLELGFDGREQLTAIANYDAFQKQGRKKKARKKKQIMNERAHIALHFVTEKIA